MLKLFGSLIKLTLFSITVLVLGNLLRWDGRTISDQIKVGMSHAEGMGITSRIRSWAHQLTSDAKTGFHIQKKIDRMSLEEEEIAPSEKQKLKALIRDLNS